MTKFAHAGTHCNPVLQDNRPLSQAPIKIRKAHSVTGNNFCVSEAPARKLHKSATPTGSVRSAGHRGGQALVASPRTSHQRRVDEAKRRQTERQTEDTQRKRLRKKELLKALQLAKLRRQFSAFGFDDVDRELKRVAAARRDQDSFGNITLGDKASWLGPLAEGLLPPKPADETPRRVVKLNRPPVAKGLKFPTEDAHPPPAPAPPVGASGLRPVPPKPGLPKLPSEPLPSLKLEKVRVKTKSEVYEPLTERETTGGMARGLARDDTVSSLYCSTPACADDVEPAKMKRRFRRVDAALGRYAKAPRRWWFRRPRAAGVGRRKG